MGASPEKTRSARSDDVDLVARAYIGHFHELTRLAMLLMGNSAEAEEIAQEAYVRTARAHRRPEDPLAYLRQSVVNLSRSSLRRRLVARRYMVATRPDDLVTDGPSTTILDRDAIMQALHSLPRRVREVLVLRYYSDLSVADTAHTLGISTGAVTSYASRGLTRLSTIMEEPDA